MRNTIEHPITKEEVIELLEQHKHDHLKDEECGGRSAASDGNRHSVCEGQSNVSMALSFLKKMLTLKWIMRLSWSIFFWRQQ